MSDKLPPLPWFKFDWLAWRNDPTVRAMHPAARAGYLELLIAQFSEGQLPDDDKKLRALSTLSSRYWKRFRGEILDKFPIKNDQKTSLDNTISDYTKKLYRSNLKMEKTRLEALTWQEKQRLRGKSGGRPKKATALPRLSNAKATVKPREGGGEVVSLSEVECSIPFLQSPPNPQKGDGVFFLSDIQSLRDWIQSPELQVEEKKLGLEYQPQEFENVTETLDRILSGWTPKRQAEYLKDLCQFNRGQIVAAANAYTEAGARDRAGHEPSLFRAYVAKDAGKYQKLAAQCELTLEKRLRRAG